MSIDIKLTIDDKALQAALKDPQLIAGPVRDFLSQSAYAVEFSAKELAPVDTGHMRDEIVTRLGPVRAIVISPVVYSPYVEFGTRPHFPPPGALQPWARRHGISAFALARAIARRGTKAHPFMRPALEKNKPNIRLFLADAVKAIEKRWREHGRKVE